MTQPVVTIRAGHPDFLDLDWRRPLESWSGGRLVEVPTGIHRHVVRFAAYGERIYAIKELPLHLARRERDILRRLEDETRSSSHVAGMVERGWVDPAEEWAAALITEYVRYAFSYRELVEAGGFGDNRDRMLDAFAGLLAELHLVGCFWGDCSLSNVLYRWDANSIQAIMIDAETAEMHDRLSDGQRLHDLDIMRENVAGGMADVAAAQGIPLERADLTLGDDIITRYRALWEELSEPVRFGPRERYRVTEKVTRLHNLGFHITDLQFRPAPDGEATEARFRVAVGGRSYHSNRLWELARVEASEHQSRWIIRDLRYFQASLAEREAGNEPVGAALAAIRWRVECLEPLLRRLHADFPDRDPLQRYTDFLHHRYLMAVKQNRDVGNEEAYDHWLTAGAPGMDRDTDDPAVEQD